jgi:GH25 family lysozyme M1 (1,4-beta-N-acetylmuramidase)
MAYKGIDISHNNVVTDWRKVKAAGIDFVMLRCGYGCIDDRKFKEYIKGAQSAGLTVGIYYFSYALSAADATKEADHCLKLIKPYKIDLGVYFDFEYDSEVYGAKKGAVYTRMSRTAIHKAFCERIRAAGYGVGIYTNVDYITSRVNWSELRGYALWLAQWMKGVDKPIAWSEVKPESVNIAHGKPTIWQIGLGVVDGIKNHVDINYGYMALPENKPTPAPPASAPTIKLGDKVRVKNTTPSGKAKLGKLYGGGTFVVYRDDYDVLSVSGTRVVIGFNKAVTAAVDASNLEKL